MKDSSVRDADRQINFNAAVYGYVKCMYRLNTFSVKLYKHLPVVGVLYSIRHIELFTITLRTSYTLQERKVKKKIEWLKG